MDRQRYKFITVKLTAKLLGCSTRTVRRIIEKGHIQAVKIGGIWHINYKSVIDYIKRNSNVELEKEEDYYTFIDLDNFIDNI